MSKVIRLCLDLNIWCASLLADFKGRENTACQTLVNLVRQRGIINFKNQINLSTTR
jgi:hypothetical protein